MDMQFTVSLSKMFHEGLFGLSILRGIFVCLQMSDGGQIQQQHTIASFLFPPQHQFTLLEILLILHNVSS